MYGLYRRWEGPISKTVSFPKRILSSCVSPVTFWFKNQGDWVNGLLLAHLVAVLN